jgi:hypothetical protein
MPNLTNGRWGTRFTQVCISPVFPSGQLRPASPGHATFGNNDSNGQRVSLRPQDTTIAQILKAQIRTGIIGKWGLGEPGTDGIPNKKALIISGYLNQNSLNYYQISLAY